MKILSIEIGEFYTRVANVQVNRGKYALGENFVIKTPQNTYEDGYIHESEELMDMLFAGFHKYGITNRRAAFVINSTKIISREVELPVVPENKIRPLVMSNITEYFPVDLSYYQVSYKVMERFVVDNQKKMKLMVFVVPKDLVDNYIDLANSLGLSLQSIDYAGNAMYQLIKNVDKEDLTVSLHIGETTSFASLVLGGVLQLQRTIPIGVDSILTGIEEVFPDLNGDHYKLFELLKSTQFVNGMFSSDDEDEENMTDDEIMLKRVTENFRPLLDRMGRITHYYTSKNGDVRFDRLLISGPGANICGIDQLLQYELGMVVNPAVSIKSIKTDTKNVKVSNDELSANHAKEVEITREVNDVASCIGGVISPLDFLPAAKKGKKNVHISLVPGIVAASASLVACVALVAWGEISYRGAEQEKEDLTARIEELKPVENVFAEHDAVKKVLMSTKDMVGYSRNPNERLVKFIEELEQKMPENSAIQSMNATVGGVDMNFQVNSWEEAADVITQLKSFKSLIGVSISSVQEVKLEKENEIIDYYVNGEKVDSLIDSLEDDDEKVEMMYRTETEVSYVYTFSVSCDWKNILELEQEENAEAEPETTATENNGEEVAE